MCEARSLIPSIEKRKGEQGGWGGRNEKERLKPYKKCIVQFSWEIGAGTLVLLGLPPWEKVCQREARSWGSIYEFWETDRAWEQREGAWRVQITSSNPQQSRSCQAALKLRQAGRGVGRGASRETQEHGSHC